MAQGESGSDNLFHLPKHQQCAVHTLNLVATKDAEEALNNKVFKAVSRKVFSKCQALWNKQSQSTLAADEIRDKCAQMFSVPIVTRWNSMYRAMESVRNHLEKSCDHLDSLFEALKIPKFQDNEIEFISEYCSVYKPLAQALDILQGEKNIHLGYLLPTITILTEKLRQGLENARDCRPLLEALLGGLEKRFGHLLQDETLLISSACHPKFKLTWLKNEESKRDARASLILEVEKIHPKEISAESQTSEILEDDDFFSSVTPRSNLACEVVDQFLSMKDQSLGSLKIFPSLEKVFRKFNTVLPSSAPVERLFSVGGSLFRPNRHRMSDAHFEQQLLLKVNQKISAKSISLN